MNLTLKDLSIGYRDKTVAGPLNATLKEGELCCLLGPNGAGKSTLLRTLAYFQKELQGNILLNESPIHSFTPQEFSRLVGVVLTEKVDAQGMTVRDLVGMGRSPYTNFWGKLNEEDVRTVEHAMSQVGIKGLSSRQIGTLSDGERQKVMIAKALAQGTPIILLDEPTAFLDFPSKAETMLLLRQLCREMRKTILLSTHDLDMALQCADVLWLMGNGGEMVIGSPMQLAQPTEEGKESALAQFFQSEHLKFNSKELRFNIV